MKLIGPLLCAALTGALATGCATATPQAQSTATTPATTSGAAPAATSSASSAVDVPDVLRFSAKTVEGQQFDGATLAGKPVVLWFWAAWCTKCRGDADELRTLQQAVGDRVNLVGVAGLGSGERQMARFVADHRLNAFPHLADDSGVLYRRFEVPSQHYYVVLDPAGRELHRGPLTVEQLREKLGLMALALAAGMLAAVNPCGFALLPAYLSLLIAGEQPEGGGPWGRVARALALTGAMTLGFVAVFGAFGLLAAPAAGWLGQRLPWLTVAVGLLLIVLGGWLLSGRDLPSPVPKAGRAPRLTHRFGAMVLFGMSFALASLGCTIGPFLVVVASSLGADPVAGIGLFLAYAAGMALVVGVAAVAVALSGRTVLGWLRRSAAVAGRVAGGLMLLAGCYVAWYGWYGIRQLTDPDATDPVVDAFGRAQTAVAAALDTTGPLTITAVLIGLLAVAAATRLARRRDR